MKNVKKLLAFALALCLVLALCACGGKTENGSGETAGNTSGTPSGTTTGTPVQAGKEIEKQEEVEKTSLTSDKTLTIALSGEPNRLIPDFAYCSNNVVAVAQMMYEPLIAAEWPWILNKDGLVTDWEYIDDAHLKLRLTLRQGVKYQNGSEMTAEDVVYMFQNGANYYEQFEKDQCYAEDDYHVVLVAVQPWGQLVDMLSTGMFLVVDKEECEAHGGANTDERYLPTAGTGKYVFNEWKQGEYISVVRNEDYWNKDNDPGYYKEVVFRFISDSTANGLAAQSGDVDIAAGASLANAEVYLSDPNVTLSIVDGNMTYLALNDRGEGSPFHDQRVREAVRYLVDPVAYRDIATFGYGTLADTVISPKLKYYDGIYVAPEINADKAKALLAEAGYPDGLTLRFRGTSSNASVDILQEQLRQGGITLDVITGDMTTHFQGLAMGDYDMYLAGGQATYYSETLRCMDGLGWDWADLMGGCHYMDEEWHELVLSILECTDESKLPELFKEFQAQFRERCVSIGIYQGVSAFVVRNGIEGATLSGIGVPDFTHVYEAG